MYIHEKKDWYKFRWDEERIKEFLSRVHSEQSRLVSEMNRLGVSLKNEAVLTTLTLDVLKSSEIEGEVLSRDEIRSSIARRLGLNVSGMVEPSLHVDGVVQMMLDATLQYRDPLTSSRLFSWHAALFPTGYSGMYKIDVGRFRTGEMNVVSGAMGKEKIHFSAPGPDRVELEMYRFMDWFNSDSKLDPILKAGIAHFWFIAIHPFDDGNGRIARAIADMQLVRSDESPDRFYSMSNQILAERKKYYEILERTQKGDSDITEWLLWFLDCLERALQNTESELETVFAKARFWKKHRETPLNERQVKVINRLLDGFTGVLKSSKYAKMTKVSQDTATRDIKDLIEKGIMRKQPGGGRSTHYELIPEPNPPKE